MVKIIHLIKEHTINVEISTIKVLLKGVCLYTAIQEIYVKASQTFILLDLTNFNTTRNKEIITINPNYSNTSKEQTQLRSNLTVQE
ncbi:MAG: hypothetical protein P0116_02960 [Candidatus Nitrosocosmicus sp.]|nr:hypothetical protein [Candidatus Nitrosocosmicus sp.]